jgi:UvrB/UvrC motif-containing protein
MSLDLNDLLRDWPHEPGQIKVRRILGTDGKEKIQLRIDLGLIQMETTGRPDGERPFGCESLLNYHVALAQEKETAHEAYQLSPDEVSELQQEGIQYYHRYISLFQLNDFTGVIRDTQRNIDLFNFVSRHGGTEEYAHSLEQFRPYVLMMNTRARASIELEREDFAAAIRQIERGRQKILEIFTGVDAAEATERTPEIAFLDEWMEEIRAKQPKQPLTKLERMQREMEAAVANEAYERAAELRDAIRAQTARKKESGAELRPGTGNKPG